MKNKSIIAIAVLAIVFGIMTLISGGGVLFFDGQARADAGNYLPFVLWFNFIAGFAYIAAGAGLLLWRHWAVQLSLLIALATVVVFAIFGILVLSGTEYEARTMGAMVLRSTVWIFIAWYVRKVWGQWAGQS